MVTNSLNVYCVSCRSFHWSSCHGEIEFHRQTFDSQAKLVFFLSMMPHVLTMMTSSFRISCHVCFEHDEYQSDFHGWSHDAFACALMIFCGENLYHASLLMAGVPVPYFSEPNHNPLSILLTSATHFPQSAFLYHMIVRAHRTNCSEYFVPIAVASYWYRAVSEHL